MQILTNGIVLSQGKWLTGLNLILSKGKIIDIVPDSRDIEGSITDLGGLRVVPGFIDIHVHGGSGSDTMDGTFEAIGTLAGFAAAHGTTSILPTTMSCPLPEIRHSAENVYRYMQEKRTGANILGLHLEGPFLNPEAKGAHPEANLLPPSIKAFQEMVGEAASVVRLVTLAPETNGAKELVVYLKDLGITASIGHTTGNYDQASSAVQMGMTHTCHFYNAMTPLKHRDPGTVGAVLDNDISTIELIADLIHVHPAALRLAVKTKGPDKTVLITDAMAAAGLGDGDYTLGGLTVYVRNGEARLHDGTLAGSTLTQDRALLNMVASGVSVEDTIMMLTETPARVIGVHHQKGKIQPGFDADLALLDEDLEVRGVYVMGERMV